MVLRYTELQSTLKVDLIGTKTLSGTTDIKVIDLTAAPYAHGVHTVMLCLQNMALTGTATLVARGNTATDGTGTDTTVQTMAIGASDTEVAIEIPNELLGHFSDRASAGYFKSLVFDITGTDTNTVEAVIVAEAMQRQDALTPSDVTAVT